MNRNRKDKRPNGIPTGIMRMDKELLSEIKMYISLGYTVSQTAKAFKVSEQMVIYACKMGKDFDSLQDDFIKEGEE